ncbi:biotin transporter BioY [Streptomyces sp. MST-110588]|uniref:biotin transporter BioY n=1 Tax=Streptomyces sp. MST-110588 TaxID=2833628 RepID=UPI001F5DB802|nr:biotin transporter BioY [Streptomyces sp. MST-110588]UNO39500.1 biotin transporter BioY [Streptomyces sp. MST-110588]
MDTDSARPAVTALRLSAFKTHRGVNLPLEPLTLLTGPSGSGKTSALQAYEILARLGSGARLERAVTAVTGEPAGCVPQWARPDGQRRRGFRIGCTVDGPAGPVTLDLAVQAEPELRIVGERLTGGGRTLLSTALTDPERRAVQAAWHTAGMTPVTRAPLPDDLLGTALLPLRVAGKTEGQRLVLAAAEQVVVALRSVFACDPRPEVMRKAVGAASPRSGEAGGCVREGGGGSGGGGSGGGGSGGGGRAHGTGPVRGAGDFGDGRLRGTCDNLPAVLERTSRECVRRHAALVEAVREGCVGPVEGLRTEAVRTAGAAERAGLRTGMSTGAGAGARDGSGGSAGPGTGTGLGPGAGAGAVRALIERGELGATPVERLGDGELRYLALALVLLTGPGVLAMDPVAEVPSARQVLTVVADGLDRCLDRRQARALLALAVRMVERGHIRLLGTVRDASAVEGLPGVRVLHLGA